MKIKDFYNAKAWKYFSRYVLLYYSDGLITKCITCGKFMQINTKEAQCGHLIRVTESFATAFEFTNTGPQCVACNRYHGGRQDIMYKKLVAIHGQKAIDMLYIKKHNICHLDKFLLNCIAEEYKKKFNELVKIKGNPWK